MIRHIQDVYRRIRQQYERVAPNKPNNGIRTGNTNNSLLGDLFAKTNISATGLTSESLDTVTQSWQNVGGYLYRAMNAKRIELEERGES
jgi:hypothetical protein